MEWVEWADTYAPTCPNCRQFYSERTPPETPPCESCRVELEVKGREAGKIYRMVRGQVITRHNGKLDVVVDLNHLAVWEAIRQYRVSDPIDCFEKVMGLFYSLRDGTE